MSNKQLLSNYLKVEFPVIMAPMFLVSSVKMVIEAMKCGIAGVIPSLNYRTDDALGDALDDLNTFSKSKSNKGTYGINLIVQSSNLRLEKDLEVCVQKKVPFYITSLGSPEIVIERAKEYGAIVFSDVTNLKHAKRVYDLGVDGFIAVGDDAGGHSGTESNNTLVPSLLKNFPEKPVIAAGGIANAKGIASMLSLGAVGVSIGTLFIASDEAPVSNEYKEAIISSGREDIVMTLRLSGAPVSIINTPFYKGLKKADEERKNTKGIDSTAESKMETMNKGIRMLEKSIKPGNYNNLWVAGKSVEMINLIKPVAKIIETLKDEFQNVWNFKCEDP